MATPRPLSGILAGIAAGLIASAVMNGFQSLTAALQSGDSDSDEDPATVKAADALAGAATGNKVPYPYRAASGQAVHYVLGGALGGLYGLLAEYRPATTAGFGTAYGLALAATLDEAAVPAVGLGPAPWDSPLSTHLYGAASHLVFGAALEGTRALLAGRR